MSNLTVVVSRPSFIGVGAAGLLALATAMGIGRFAFTPLLPLMIGAGSLDVAAGGWLASANYAGYLLGALTTARLPLTPQRTAMLALAIIAASTAAMGWSLSTPLSPSSPSLVSWMLLRFVAGVASAWALVSTSVWCLAWLSHLQRPGGAGVLYAGVGVGIAVAGLHCWRGGAAGVSPDALWVQLGLIALVALLVVAVLTPRAMPASVATTHGAPASGAPPRPARTDAWALVICYGALGFGYILPATFLPVLARAVIDNAAVFGAAWPVFGVAAALSTLGAGVVLARVSRRRVLAGSHVLMALGCLLPVLHLSVGTVLAAALLVGGTFMVATMAGMQEARASTAGDPTRALGRMTAAFAIGQMAGPILSSILSTSTQGFGGLLVALSAGALALLASAAWLWRRTPVTS